MTPSSFRNLRALERLNVAGVGLSLAALTAAIGLHLDGNPSTAFGVGVPTLDFGTLWARLLRWPRTLMGTSLRVAWLLSVPLAAANAALAAALVFGGAESHLRGGEVLMFLGMGATLGVVVWGPALLATPRPSSAAATRSAMAIGWSTLIALRREARPTPVRRPGGRTCSPQRERSLPRPTP
ncbi:MAG: hypothetical protein EPO40_16120 [Myxococcaceae bacterium]|nr:MAG: hypothetical protein EPO40_16120 [Myxococcaceae bacterium]